jgi:hypothetical protein
MIRCDDNPNIRLDVLTPPDDENNAIWMRDTEAALVRKFNPLFNNQLQLYSDAPT